MTPGDGGRMKPNGMEIDIDIRNGNWYRHKEGVNMLYRHIEDEWIWKDEETLTYRVISSYKRLTSESFHVW